MSMDPFADALVHIKNSDFVSKKECTVSHPTKILSKVLDIMSSEKYIEGYASAKSGNHSVFNVKLNGNITNCGAIKPRFAMDTLSYEVFEKKYLPARNVGVLIVSTPQGIMTHIDAKKKNIGGRLLAYVY